jgi:hypothetical protein
MPEISRFLGIVITLNYSDHPPPHFHVRYGKQKALVSIQPLALLQGQLSPRVLGLVMEWATLHQAELRENWELARQQVPLNKIDPWSNSMLKDVIEVYPLEDYRLRLCFEDGATGIVDMTKVIQFKGVFASLQNRAYFLQVRINPDTGTICWPNEADIDPDVLYALVTGEPISTFNSHYHQ